MTIAKMLRSAAAVLAVITGLAIAGPAIAAGNKIGISTTIDNIRIEASEKELRDTKIQVLYKQFANRNPDKGFEVMQNFLQRSPEIDDVGAGDDIFYPSTLIIPAIELTAMRVAAQATIRDRYVLDSPLIAKENAAEFYVPDSPH